MVGTSGTERVWREVDGDDPKTWVHSRDGSQGGCLSFYLNTLALRHWAPFQIELHSYSVPFPTLLTLSLDSGSLVFLPPLYWQTGTCSSAGHE